MAHRHYRREAIAKCEQERPRETARAIRRYKTTELFGDSPWIVIEHRNVEYRLQVTRLGKLILTK
jgi:hemin uptake protein HemP